jgi:hypothetical protein
LPLVLHLPLADSYFGLKLKKIPEIKHGSREKNKWENGYRELLYKLFLKKKFFHGAIRKIDFGRRNLNENIFKNPIKETLTIFKFQRTD